MATPLQESRFDVYQKIVAAAVLAPSAENTQPWRFIVTGDELLVYLDTSRTLASDIDQMLSLTAMGACIENAVVAATTQNLQAEVEYLTASMPTRSESPQVPIARIRIEGRTQRDPLADCIESRCTARRMDPRRQLDAASLNQLQQSSEIFPGVTIHWVDRGRLSEFAKLVGIGNRIRFEHPPFHRELYDNLRFTSEEAQQSRDGLDVATLQLPPPVAAVLTALRSWPRMKWANMLGFARFVARQAAQEVCNSGAVGFLTVDSSAVQQFVNGGRALERLWLTATRLGFCFHPTASLPVFLAYARARGRQLEARHRTLVADMAQRFHRLFPEAANETIQIAFRIGYGPMPPIRSLGRKVEDVLWVRGEEES